MPTHAQSGMLTILRIFALVNGFLVVSSAEIMMPERDSKPVQFPLMDAESLQDPVQVVETSNWSALLSFNQPATNECDTSPISHAHVKRAVAEWVKPREDTPNVLIINADVQPTTVIERSPTNTEEMTDYKLSTKMSSAAYSIADKTSLSEDSITNLKKKTSGENSENYDSMTTSVKSASTKSGETPEESSTPKMSDKQSSTKWQTIPSKALPEGTSSAEKKLPPVEQVLTKLIADSTKSSSENGAIDRNEFRDFGSRHSVHAGNQKLKHSDISTKRVSKFETSAENRSTLKQHLAKNNSKSSEASETKVALIQSESMMPTTPEVDRHTRIKQLSSRKNKLKYELIRELDGVIYDAIEDVIKQIDHPAFHPENKSQRHTSTMEPALAGPIFRAPLKQHNNQRLTTRATHTWTIEYPQDKSRISVLNINYGPRTTSSPTTSMTTKRRATTTTTRKAETTTMKRTTSTNRSTTTTRRTTTATTRKPTTTTRKPTTTTRKTTTKRLTSRKPIPTSPVDSIEIYKHPGVLATVDIIIPWHTTAPQPGADHKGPTWILCPNTNEQYEAVNTRHQTPWSAWRRTPMKSIPTTPKATLGTTRKVKAGPALSRLLAVTSRETTEQPLTVEWDSHRGEEKPQADTWFVLSSAESSASVPKTIVTSFEPDTRATTRETYGKGFLWSKEEVLTTMDPEDYVPNVLPTSAKYLPIKDLPSFVPLQPDSVQETFVIPPEFTKSKRESQGSATKLGTKLFKKLDPITNHTRLPTKLQPAELQIRQQIYEAFKIKGKNTTPVSLKLPPLVAPSGGFGLFGGGRKKPKTVSMKVIQENKPVIQITDRADTSSETPVVVEIHQADQRLPVLKIDKGPTKKKRNSTPKIQPKTKQIELASKKGPRTTVKTVEKTTQVSLKLAKTPGRKTTTNAGKWLAKLISAKPTTIRTKEPTKLTKTTKATTTQSVGLWGTLPPLPSVKEDHPLMLQLTTTRGPTSKKPGTKPNKPTTIKQPKTNFGSKTTTAATSPAKTTRRTTTAKSPTTFSNDKYGLKIMFDGGQAVKRTVQKPVLRMNPPPPPRPTEAMWKEHESIGKSNQLSHTMNLDQRSVKRSYEVMSKTITRPMPARITFLHLGKNGSLVHTLNDYMTKIKNLEAGSRTRTGDSVRKNEGSAKINTSDTESTTSEVQKVRYDIYGPKLLSSQKKPIGQNTANSRMEIINVGPKNETKSGSLKDITAKTALIQPAKRTTGYFGKKSINSWEIVKRQMKRHHARVESSPRFSRPNWRRKEDEYSEDDWVVPRKPGPSFARRNPFINRANRMRLQNLWDAKGVQQNKLLPGNDKPVRVRRGRVMENLAINSA